MTRKRVVIAGLGDVGVLAKPTRMIRIDIPSSKKRVRFIGTDLNNGNDDMAVLPPGRWSRDSPAYRTRGLTASRDVSKLIETALNTAAMQQFPDIHRRKGLQ